MRRHRADEAIGAVIHPLAYRGASYITLLQLLDNKNPEPVLPQNSAEVGLMPANACLPEAVQGRGPSSSQSSRTVLKAMKRKTEPRIFPLLPSVLVFGGFGVFFKFGGKEMGF